MATVSKVIFSSTTTGEAQYAPTGRGGLHTAGSAQTDELWVYATNNGSTRETLTIGWGGAGVEEEITQAIDALSGLTLIIPGLIITNNSVYFYASTASTISVVGYANRIE